MKHVFRSGVPVYLSDVTGSLEKLKQVYSSEVLTAPEQIGLVAPHTPSPFVVSNAFISVFCLTSFSVLLPPTPTQECVKERSYAAPEERGAGDQGVHGRQVTGGREYVIRVRRSSPRSPTSMCIYLGLTKTTLQVYIAELHQRSARYCRNLRYFTNPKQCSGLMITCWRWACYSPVLLNISPLVIR